MAHEVAKLLLEHASGFLERQEAVRTALQLGMPLGEIEEYLDWVDVVRPPDRASEEGCSTEDPRTGNCRDDRQ